MDKKSLLYSGKAKSLYQTDEPNYLIAEFRDDTSAFDGQKVTQLQNKGMVNNQFNAKIMQKLEQAGVKTHFVKLLDETHAVVKRLEMLPIECVIRNIAAGSLCRRLGVAKQTKFEPALFEFFLKNDELHDPMICEEHILAFNWATAEEVKQLKQLSHQVNDILSPLFAEKGLLLVDFKLEFGRGDGMLILGDEFTPDGCRVWDADTLEVLDKDRFRQDLGDVVEHYQILANRLAL